MPNSANNKKEPYLRGKFIRCTAVAWGMEYQEYRAKLIDGQWPRDPTLDELLELDQIIHAGTIVDVTQAQLGIRLEQPWVFVQCNNGDSQMVVGKVEHFMVLLEAYHKESLKIVHQKMDN